jgi:Ala-tRNA(Pro) deacylase
VAGTAGSRSSGSETTSSDSIVASLDWRSAPAERDRPVAPTDRDRWSSRGAKVADVDPWPTARTTDEKDCSMPILTRLREFLETNKVPYSVHSHPQAFTAQEIAALEHVSGRMLAKVVMIKAGAQLIMVVIPADHRVDLDRIKGSLGSDVRLATEAEFRDAFPGCEVGAMPPFGNLFGIPVYVDRTLEQDEEIVFNAGNHTLTAKLAFDDFVRLTEPRMVDVAVQR